jgi:hypothetical protein
MLLEVKLLVRKQDKASKDTFSSNSIDIAEQFKPKISHQKMKNVTRGGGSEKCQKSVTYYLNGPIFQSKGLYIK